MHLQVCRLLSTKRRCHIPSLLSSIVFHAKLFRTSFQRQKAYVKRQIIDAARERQARIHRLSRVIKKLCWRLCTILNQQCPCQDARIVWIPKSRHLNAVVLWWLRDIWQLWAVLELMICSRWLSNNGVILFRCSLADHARELTLEKTSRVVTIPFHPRS